MNLERTSRETLVLDSAMTSPSLSLVETLTPHTDRWSVTTVVNLNGTYAVLYDSRYRHVVSRSVTRPLEVPVETPPSFVIITCVPLFPESNFRHAVVLIIFVLRFFLL